jgi:hypothetical protein
MMRAMMPRDHLHGAEAIGAVEHRQPAHQLRLADRLQFGLGTA